VVLIGGIGWAASGQSRGKKENKRRGGLRLRGFHLRGAGTALLSAAGGVARRARGVLDAKRTGEAAVRPLEWLRLGCFLGKSGVALLERVFLLAEEKLAEGRRHGGARRCVRRSWEGQRLGCWLRARDSVRPAGRAGPSTGERWARGAQTPARTEGGRRGEGTCAPRHSRGSGPGSL